MLALKHILNLITATFGLLIHYAGFPHWVNVALAVAAILMGGFTVVHTIIEIVVYFRDIKRGSN